MILLLARLGGFLARRSDKNPGPKTIWLGLKNVVSKEKTHNHYRIFDNPAEIESAKNLGRNLRQLFLVVVI